MLKTEEAPLNSAPPPELRPDEAIRHLEAAVAGSTEFEGLGAALRRLLRAGLGPLRRFVHRSAAPPAGVPVVGDGGGFWSFLHVDDAAAATAIAVVRGGRPRTVQHRRRRPRAGQRLAAGARRYGRRQVAAAHSAMARADRGRRASGLDDDREPRRIERQGEKRATLAPGPRVLAARLRRGAPAAADLGQNPIGASVGVCLAGRPPRETTD